MVKDCFLAAIILVIQNHMELECLMLVPVCQILGV